MTDVPQGPHLTLAEWKQLARKGGKKLDRALDEVVRETHKEGIPVRLMKDLFGGKENYNLRRRSHRRTVAVRLTDVAPEVRLAAAKRIRLHESNGHTRRALMLAAMFPSDKTYYVSGSALDIIEEVCR